MEVNVIKAWKDPEYRAQLKENGIAIEQSPVENNLDLSLISGGAAAPGPGRWHTWSGECNAMGHVHDCSTLNGFGSALADNMYSFVGWGC